jgi:hypothetical protein
MTEGILSVFLDPHEGQGMFRSLSPKTSSSYTLPHEAQRYSKIGISTLLGALGARLKILDARAIAIESADWYPRWKNKPEIIFFL